MKLRNCIVGTAALSLLAIAAAIAQDATTAPSEEHRTTRTRMVAPFNLLSDLSDDQNPKSRIFIATSWRRSMRSVRRSMTTSWRC